MKSMLCVLSMSVAASLASASADVKPAPIHYKNGQNTAFATAQTDARARIETQAIGEPRNLIAHLHGAEEPFVSYGLTEPFVLEDETHAPQKPFTRPEPKLIAAPTQPVVKATPRDAFEIQIGSYSQFSNANAVMSKYASVSPARIAHATVNGRDYYRVMLAGGQTRNEAERQLVSLSRIGVDGFIVTKK